MTINKSRIRKRREKKKEEPKVNVELKNKTSNLEKNKSKIPTFVGKRLSIVSKELNIGVSELIEYLNSNGVEIELNPNSKLGIEHIEALQELKKKFEESFVIDYTYKLLEELKIDYSLIFKISPEKFEKLVAELLSKNNFTVRLIGSTNRKDGGIDIIAWKKEIVTIVLAIQVKFKSFEQKKVTASEVRDFQGALSLNNWLTAGMVVTNTDFTIDAKWIEEQLNSKLELKNYEDIKSWLNRNFITRKETKLMIDLAKDIKFEEVIK